MKRIDFESVCWKCGHINIIPLKVKDSEVVRDNSYFHFSCYKCEESNTVRIIFKVETKPSILN